MKKILIIVLLVSAFFATPAMAEQKIGFVSIPEVLVSSEPGKEASRLGREMQDNFKSKMITERKAIQEMQIQREKQKKMLKPEALEDMDRKIRERMFRFQEDAKKGEVDLREKQNELSTPVLTMLGEVLEAYGKKHGYTAIFNKTQMPYVSDSADLTQELINELNKAWKNKK